MISEFITSDITETTIRLAEIICRKFEENTSGSLRGYLVMDDKQGIITKEERKNYSTFDDKNDQTLYYGSVKCSETKPFSRSLTAMVIAYAVRNNLMRIFGDYPFEKFEIDLESYPKYRFEQNRFLKYQKTEDDVSFLKIDMKW